MKQILNLIIITLILSTCGLITGCKTDENQKDKRAMNDEYRLLPMDQIHRKKLQEIQYWSMKKGVAEFYKTRDVSHIAEYVKSRGYGLVLQPQINESRICAAEGRYKGKKYKHWQDSLFNNNILKINCGVCL